MARTLTTTLSIDDVITDIAAHDDGWRHRGCDWDSAPCGEATTHAIAIRAVADVNEPHSHISTYCPRHYVATMFHILEVEAPLNGVEFDVLVSKHGPIAEWG